MTDAEKTASGVEPTSKATSSHTSTTMTTAATALDMTDQQQNVPEGFVWTPLTAALFYATSSILIMFANKLVLTHFAFPSFVFLGVLQGVTTLIMMHLLRAAGAISFPRATWALLASTFPVPLLFTLNNLTALGGMQHLNLPMFVVLRRFSILMTMVAERFVLGKRHSPSTQASVFLMLAGALVAAIYDMTFNLWGYIYVLANDVFTAANGVAVAHKYATKRAGTWGMLYVNTLFSVPAMLTYMIVMRPHEFQHLREFTQWSSPLFAMSLCLSGSLGFGINYGVFICTKLTSPLTTTVIGCLKNVVTTYGGMVMGYQINTQNFAGLTVSTFASVWYSYVAFYEGVAKRAAQQAKDEKAALSAAESGGEVLVSVQSPLLHTPLKSLSCGAMGLGSSSTHVAFSDGQPLSQRVVSPVDGGRYMGGVVPEGPDGETPSSLSLGGTRGRSPIVSSVGPDASSSAPAVTGSPETT
eukprot:TRINITY_DN409_c0_g1_i1.p1 TRINITY_DN409_c0_g1~~TRINITY_DN409_c0_g1_i1.p1  ORF type:complete len:470 (+),score=129.75 TRINITY_DN409_c0_g1_i1:115-1524(+)